MTRRGWSDGYGLFSEVDNLASGGGVHKFHISPGSSFANAFNLVALSEGTSDNGSIVSGRFEAIDHGSTTYQTMGVWGSAYADQSTDHSDLHDIIGVKGTSEAALSNQNVFGGHFSARGLGAWQRGAYANAEGPNSIRNIGIQGSAAGGTTLAIGVYGTIDSPNCTTGTCSRAAGYFGGPVYATNYFTSSDLMLKENIEPLLDATSIIMQLQPKNYNFKTDDYPSMALPDNLQYGFIAQEVSQVLPSLVKTFVSPETTLNDGTHVQDIPFQTINYDALIPILTAALKEQQERIDSLISSLNSSAGTGNRMHFNSKVSQQITLSDLKSIILNQNEPNPFGESTRITFMVPESVIDAKMIFTNISGAIINTSVITDRGFSEIQVFSSDLSSGLYTYTLVCDGKVIDSKKMAKQ